MIRKLCHLIKEMKTSIKKCDNSCVLRLRRVMRVYLFKDQKTDKNLLDLHIDRYESIDLQGRWAKSKYIRNQRHNLPILYNLHIQQTDLQG